MASNLEELMTNIDKLDVNNPADMEQLIQGISAGAVEPADNVVAADPATPATPATPAAAANGNPVDDKATDAPITATKPTEAAAPSADPAKEERAPVATRDGKHTIPYSVLEATRAAREKAEADARAEREQREALAKQLEEKLARIKELEERGPSTTAAESKEATDLKADLEAIQEEAPYLAGVLGKLIARVEATEKIASEAKQAPKPSEPDAPSLPPEVRAAIDSVPAIAHWEATNADLFAAAAEVDNRLKTRPEWASKSMTERFQQVVKVMVAEYGDAILPPTDSATQQLDKPGAKTLPKADDAAINSISDIPGGTPTARSPLEELESASPTAIFNKLQSMDSPDDIIRFVTR